MLSECCETGGFLMFSREHRVHQSLKSLRISKVDGPENRPEKSFDRISYLCGYLQQKTTSCLKIWPMQKQHNFSYVWKICHKSLKTVFLSIGHCNESPYSGFPNLLLSKFNAKTVCNFIKSCKFMKFICIFKSYGIFNNIF